MEQGSSGSQEQSEMALQLMYKLQAVINDFCNSNSSQEVGAKPMPNSAAMEHIAAFAFELKKSVNDKLREIKTSLERPETGLIEVLQPWFWPRSIRENRVVCYIAAVVGT